MHKIALKGFMFSLVSKHECIFWDMRDKDKDDDKDLNDPNV